MRMDDVRKIMDEEYQLDNNKPSSSWATIDAVPYGIIESQEQYDYIIEYSKNTEVGLDGMKPFDTAKGMYLNLGNYFGGAAFYFSLTPVEKAEECSRKYPNIFPQDLSWSYGKYGKIEW